MEGVAEVKGEPSERLRVVTGYSEAFSLPPDPSSVHQGGSSHVCAWLDHVVDELEAELRACRDTDVVYQWMMGLRTLSMEGLSEPHVRCTLRMVETVFVRRLRVLSVEQWSDLTAEQTVLISRMIVVTLNAVYPDEILVHSP